MDQVNNLCETPNCEKVAKCFGMRGNLKIRSCGEHMSSLLDKGMEIIKIEGYYFISTSQDQATFRERSHLAEKGRGNLTALYNICDSELAAALRNIERVKGDVIKAVENRFEEMKVVVAGVCSESKWQLWQLGKELEQFLISKENQLSPAASLLCTDMSVTPKFVRFHIANMPDCVSAALSKSWAVATADICSTLRCFEASQKNEAIESILAEATNLAQKGIMEALEYADSIIGDNTSFEQAKCMVIAELWKFTKTKNTKNLNLIKYFWELRQQYAISDEGTVEVGKQLAGLFYHQLGRFSEAEAILQQCYQLASTQSITTELSMLLCIEICGVYFASEKYQQAESLGIWALETFRDANFSSEHYWTALLYVSYSMSEISKIDEAKAIVENWQKRHIPEESKLGEMMRLLTCGLAAPPTEAEKYLLRAKWIGMNNFPTSPFTALSLFHLGLSTIADARGGQYLLQAQSLYEIASPHSAQAAMNLSKLGDLNKAAKRLNEAEKCYRQAQAIYEATDSKSYNAVINFIHLGDLYSNLRRWKKGEECYQKVQSILQEAGPEHRPRLESIAEQLASLSTGSAPPSAPVSVQWKPRASQPAVQQEEWKQPVIEQVAFRNIPLYAQADVYMDWKMIPPPQLEIERHEAAASQSTRKCSKCSAELKIKKFPLPKKYKSRVYQLECTEVLCTHCLELCVRGGSDMCPICTLYVDIHKEEMLKMVCRCFGCKETKLLIQDFPTLACVGHRYCVECVPRLKFIDNCPNTACNRTFTSEERQVYASDSNLMCVNCGMLLPRDRAIFNENRQCPCVLCRKCLANMQRGSLNVSTCLSCKAPFIGDAIILQSYQNAVVSAQELEFQEMKEYDAEVEAWKNRLPKCRLCYDPIFGYLNAVYSGNCLHVFHRSCFKDAIDVDALGIIQHDKKRSIKCPIDTCKEEVSAVHCTGNLALIEPDIFDKFMLYNKLLTHREFVCGRGCTEVNYIEKELAHFACIHCHLDQCVVCKALWTPDHDEKVCGYTVVQAIIKERFTEPENCQCQGAGCECCFYAQCPGCKLPYLKDHHSDHVICMNPECKTVFCFQCACLRYPTLEHCNTWHRRQCPNFPKNESEELSAKIVRGEKRRSKCPECARLGMLCMPPPNLKRIRRFDLSEY